MYNSKELEFYETCTKLRIIEEFKEFS